MLSNGISFALSPGQVYQVFPRPRRQNMDIGWNIAAYMGVRASRELEVVSHNLANVSTLGFKWELLNNWQLNPPPKPSGG
jgi:hypothetical protein